MDVNLVVIKKVIILLVEKGLGDLQQFTQIISHVVHHVGYLIAGIGDIENLWN